MRLHEIKTKNFLSLRDCTIAGLDPHLNFFVGPNGSGKTNIFRLLKTIRDVFVAAGIGRRSDLSQLCTQGVVPQEVDVSLAVEFNTKWEQELISAFLCAALSQPNILNTALTRLRSQGGVQLSRAEHLFFAEWLAQQIRPETVPFFFQGDLRVTYRSDIYDYLRLSYTFMCKGEPITIIMGTLAGFDGTFWSGDPPETPTQGQRSGGDILLTLLWEPRTHKGPEEGGPVFEFFNQQSELEPASLDKEAFFLLLADQKGFLEIEPLAQQYAELPTYSTLSEASGIDFRQANSPKLIFSTLFSLLINRAWVLTNNVRLPFSAPTELDANKALSPRVNLDDEQQIPLWLFRLKVGDPAEQAHFRRIQDSFSMLVGEGRGFDLNVKPPALAV